MTVFLQPSFPPSGADPHEGEAGVHRGGELRDEANAEECGEAALDQAWRHKRDEEGAGRLEDGEPQVEPENGTFGSERPAWGLRGFLLLLNFNCHFYF